MAQLPDWLRELLPTKGEQRKYPQDFGFAYPSGEKWLDEAISRVSEGNRNAVGFWLACQLRDDGISQEHAQAVLLVYANRVPQERSPYTSKEAFASVKSAFSRHPRDRAKNMYR
ncbi:MAG: primase C-terminal domain-containing protein [Ktedonobacteraceae bacterium]